MRRVLFILGQLNDSDVDWMGDHGTRMRLSKDTELIKHGTKIEAVYIVLEGALTVLTARGVRLAQVATGDILGEMSLVDSGLTTASVVAEQDSVVLALPRELLEDRLKRDVGFAARFYRALALFLADRMRNTIRRMGFDSSEPDDSSAGQSDGSELDDGVLDNVHLAGARFERMAKKLVG